MKITLAKTAGFCFGVDRAINMIHSMLDSGSRVCTLGPIIHNPQVIEELEQKGVNVVSSPEEVEPGHTLVIRTHGVPKALMESVSAAGTEYADATCPFVKKIHRIVAENSAPDIPVLIAGNASHPEVEGIKSYAAGEVFVFNNEKELESIVNNNSELSSNKVIVLSQTTFDVKEWQNCVKKVKILCTNPLIFDTICCATEERQQKAVSLARDNDAMLIIGGRTSSNTAKLKSVCEPFCPTFLVETAEELKNIDFSGFRSLGVTAGASTPARIIKEVLTTMSDIVNETTPIEEKNFDAAEAQTAASAEQDFSAMLEESLSSMSNDQKVVGVVVAVANNGEIQVDIGRKHAGYIPLDEYSNDPTADPLTEVKAGDKLNLIIMKTNDQEGTVMLSKRRFDAIKAWDDIVAASESGAILDGVVAEVIRGGILVVCNGIRVFVPASLATASRNDSLEDMLKKPVKLRIIEVTPQRKRAVGSIRAVLKETRKAAEEAFWNQAQVGQVYTGTVKSLKPYGAFVDIGGVDGMVHVSEMSWERIKTPADVMKVGDTVEVFITALNREENRISLGYRKIEDSPWEKLKNEYPAGSVAKVKIVGFTAFGAFANIIPGIDGLIHISQIANRRIDKPQDVLAIGDEVEAKVTDIDFDKKRVSLSIRALLPEEAPVEAAQDTEEKAVPIEELAQAAQQEAAQESAE
ncbi:MAG: bifunctional 4-hydroxy-3-methylbut-2-enyl diphosphate reductase/30S ribosomal protein S1 [Clostridiales bacterium]|nr:bifunctional 4-hydroxy-3-methylbut-2-enyl diphosphate reductase/30S ribosomal protein S1 [Clostridiales bacterium]